MDNLDIYSLIDKALKYYDNQKVKFKKYQTMKETIDREEQTIKFEDETYTYEALGIFDNTTKIWLWSWMDPTLMYKETKLTKQFAIGPFELDFDKAHCISFLLAGIK